jgi:hypothetical protein
VFLVVRGSGNTTDSGCSRLQDMVAAWRAGSNLPPIFGPHSATWDGETHRCKPP